MKPPVVLAVLIGTLVLACSTTTSAPAEPTPNIDATVEARIASIPTATPQIVVQKVEVEKLVVQEVVKEIEIPIEVTVVIKKLIEMEAPVGLSLGPGAFLHCYGQDTPSYA